MTQSPPAPDAGSDDALALVPEALRGAIVARGYTSLTPVQQAVLAADPGRDLRVSSQTGSGKTVAFGLVLGRTLPTLPKAQGPRALVMAPTRELAQQVRHELAWLLQPLGLRVLSVTGGTSVRGDLVALRAGADVIVGTPGRLADHVRSGAVRCDDVTVVVLDEADEMLDMGFAEELAAVLDKVPAERSMHLVSATFAAAVGALADRYQRRPLSVQGTPPGDANTDIDHVLHFVLQEERLDALVNILLLAPQEATLIFTRTREGAAELVRLLRELDIGALLLTGDLDQSERQRTLEMFRTGRLRVLVATDVAARGLDVPGITRVIHTEPPNDPDAYTHRSGRTGRAGRKGQSLMLLPREARMRALRLLARAGITPRIAPVPGADEILAAAEERVLTAVMDDDPTPDESAQRTAVRLLESLDAPTLVARLLSRPIPQLTIEPRSVTPIAVDTRPARLDPRDDRGPVRPRNPNDPVGDFVRFQVSWGAQQGADGRRVLALICRRGGVGREHVGSIRVGPQSTFVDIRSDVAEAFEASAQRPDPRDPRVRVRRAFDDRSPRPAPLSPPADDRPARFVRPVVEPVDPRANRLVTNKAANKLAADRPSAAIADGEPAPAEPAPVDAPSAHAAATRESAVQLDLPIASDPAGNTPAAPAVSLVAPAPSAPAEPAPSVPAPPAARPSGKRVPAAKVSGEQVPAARVSGEHAPAAKASGEHTPAAKASGEHTPAARPSAEQAPGVSAPAAPAAPAAASPDAAPAEVPPTPRPRSSRKVPSANTEVVAAPPRARTSRPQAATEPTPKRRPELPDTGASTAPPRRPARPDLDSPRGASGGDERPGRYQPADRSAAPGRYDRPAGPPGRYQPAGRDDRPSVGDRPGRYDRPAETRPGSYPARPERPYKPAAPGHDRPAPARPARPESPERDERPARPAAPERPEATASTERPVRRVVRLPGDEAAGDKKPKKKTAKKK